MPHELRQTRHAEAVANTSYLRYTVEPWVRERLGEKFGQQFSSEVLTLSPGGTHEFDAVSKDRSIIASIKANSSLTSGGKHPTGKVATCLNEIYYLTLVSASERMLVLTNPEFHDIFTRVTSGQIASGIGILLLPLPSEMQGEVDRVTRRASDEMSAEKRTAASALEAEEAGERGDT